MNLCSYYFYTILFVIVIEGLNPFRSTGALAQNKIALEPENTQMITEGQNIYQEQCASCHGKNLEGEPNWKTPKSNGRMPAPPHNMTGHTWHHHDALLFEITKFGTEAYIGRNYKSDMIGYKDILSDQEIVSVLSYIKSTWPLRDQRRHDQMNKRIK